MSNTKLCNSCFTLKSISEFYLRKTGKRAGQYYEKCKECFKARGRKYYYQTREHQLKLVKARTKRYLNDRLLFLAKAKNKPCSDCGKFYPPWVMDFDHINSRDKRGNISHYFLNRTWSLDKVKKEIKKCDIVCANCHRLRTYSRLTNNYLEAIRIAEDKRYKFGWKYKS